MDPIDDHCAGRCAVEQVDSSPRSVCARSIAVPLGLPLCPICGGTKPSCCSCATQAELKETETLGRLLQQTVELYRTTITPGTGDQPAAEAAANRAQEALLEMMTQARYELACEAPRDAVRDFLLGKSPETTAANVDLVAA